MSTNLPALPKLAYGPPPTTTLSLPTGGTFVNDTAQNVSLFGRVFLVTTQGRVYRTGALTASTGIALSTAASLAQVRSEAFMADDFTPATIAAGTFNGARTVLSNIPTPSTSMTSGAVASVATTSGTVALSLTSVWEITFAVAGTYTFTPRWMASAASASVDFRSIRVESISL